MADDTLCECAICKHHLEFELNEFLLSEIADDNAVIFAGAGVSTETDNAAPHSLYVELASHLGLKDFQTPFPDVAEEFSK